MPLIGRAAILFKPGEALQIRDVEVSDPAPNEVLIKLMTAGLCHSDLHILDGKSSVPQPVPVILGHEGLGEVLAVGERVSTVGIGDTIIPYLIPDCGKCAYCLSGRTNQCMEFGRTFAPNPRTTFQLDGQAVHSFLGLGTFCSHIVVREDQVQKVDPVVPAIEGCLMGCGVTTGLGSALEVAKVTKGSSVVVFGLGGVGMSVVQGARLAGATTIIGVDLNRDKEEVGRHFGLTHFVNGRDGDVVSAISRITGIGADYAFECVGSATLFEQALQSLSRGGWAEIISVGVTDDQIQIPIKWSDLHGRKWQQSFMGGAKRSDVARYTDWLINGTIDLQGMVTQVLPLDEINAGFDLMRRGETNRAVIDFDVGSSSGGEQA